MVIEIQASLLSKVLTKLRLTNVSSVENDLELKIKNVSLISFISRVFSRFVKSKFDMLIREGPLLSCLSA